MKVSILLFVIIKISYIHGYMVKNDLNYPINNKNLQQNILQPEIENEVQQSIHPQPIEHISYTNGLNIVKFQNNDKYFNGYRKIPKNNFSFKKYPSQSKQLYKLPSVLSKPIYQNVDSIKFYKFLNEPNEPEVSTEIMKVIHQHQQHDFDHILNVLNLIEQSSKNKEYKIFEPNLEQPEIPTSRHLLGRQGTYQAFIDTSPNYAGRSSEKNEHHLNLIKLKNTEENEHKKKIPIKVLKLIKIENLKQQKYHPEEHHNSKLHKRDHSHISSYDNHEHDSGPPIIFGKQQHHTNYMKHIEDIESSHNHHPEKIIQRGHVKILKVTRSKHTPTHIRHDDEHSSLAESQNNENFIHHVRIVNADEQGRLFKWH